MLWIWGGVLRRVRALHKKWNGGRALSDGGCWLYEAMKYDYSITNEHGKRRGNLLFSVESGAMAEANSEQQYE
jgi:hypothetical protein